VRDGEDGHRSEPDWHYTRGPCAPQSESPFARDAQTNTRDARATRQPALPREVRFGEAPKSELATASLRPDWRYTRDARTQAGKLCATRRETPERVKEAIDR
jgi:hypothetical protein